MIVIVDYGVGNLYSLKSSLAFLGENACVTGDPAEIRRAEKIILPGVGAFSDAIGKLKKAGLDTVLKKEAARGKPLLGICLGMQLLFEESHEYGVTEGLGLIKGKIRSVEADLGEPLKVPHMGWNRLEIRDEAGDDPVFRYFENGDYVYYVHSFYGTDCGESVLAGSRYGVFVPGVVRSGSVYGMQFHPEKSGSAGLGLLKAFVGPGAEEEKEKPSVLSAAGAGSAGADPRKEKTAAGKTEGSRKPDTGGRGTSAPDRAPLELFPAIDLREGRAVRLYQGDYDRMTVYDDDPAAAACRFREGGAGNLHLVDLDGARDGTAANFPVIRRIVEETGLFVQVGGGIRNEERILRYLDIGVSRVILGTAAVTDGGFLREMVKKYGSRIAVGVDVRDGKAAIRGWTEITEKDGIGFCRELAEAGVETVIYTDISRDGAMAGTNLAAYEELRRAVPELKIIASGGVRFEEEIRTLRNMGLHGAILGKALYTGDLRLDRALELAGRVESGSGAGGGDRGGARGE